ncbi:esterase-like activity of phytase family protein [Frigidibacter sp. MR17.14]|uniref:esterase-like activity of phytase family protein n=1 Tax=Frigidibacter sp. MR17.14 TaxID=3126509 RepID=UPI003012FFD4
MHHRSRLGLIALAATAGLACLALPLLPPGAAGGGAASGSEPPLPGVFVGAFTWKDPDPAFGGLSGIELTQDGLGFVTVSDRGTTFSGRLTRNAAGAVTAAVTTPAQALHALSGAELSGLHADAEGIALDPGGGVWISFEQFARVDLYDTPGSRARPGPRAPAFRRLEDNGALEALAIDAQGRLVTLAEEPLDGRTDTPVWRLEGNQWREAFSITRDRSWKPVGADFGSDGRLYLLERAFWPPFGFQSRVRSFDPGSTGTRPDPGRPILASRVGEFDNLEGLATWTDARGDIRLTMVSDDNFLSLQRTQLIDYRLPRDE